MISLLVATSLLSAALAVLARGARVDGSAGRLALLSLPRGSTVFSVLARMGGSPMGRSLVRHDDLISRLQLAGRRESAEVIVGLRLVLAASAFLACLVGAAVVPLTLVLAPILAVVCFRFPDLVLARLAARRQARIAANVPEFLELLVATTEAGLGPQAAFRRSAEVASDPLGSELRSALRHVDLGLPWRQVLEQVLERTDVPSLTRVLGTLSRSQRLGTSLRSTLQSVQRDLRSERRARAEELARRAPVKMLFPLVFLILPAFLLLTVGPVLLATLRSLD